MLTQRELMIPFIDKYFSIIEEVVNKKDREFAQIFCRNLSPSLLARDEDETAFKNLLAKKTKDETHFFTQFLKAEIESIEIIKKAR